MSTSAAACPKCGAPRNVALAAPKPNAKRGTFILIAVVTVFGYLGVHAALSTGHDGTPVSGQNAPVKRIDLKAEYMKQVGTVTQAMADMNVAVAGQSIDAMAIVVDTFNLAARLTNEAAEMSLDKQQSDLVHLMGAAVVKRQLEVFPLMREKVGPILAKKVWEADVMVTTKGKRFDTMEFVGGTYAANHNIAKSQETMYPVLMRLRFKRSEYKWIPSADTYTQYPIGSPADGALAVVSESGAVTTTVASL